MVFFKKFLFLPLFFFLVFVYPAGAETRTIAVTIDNPDGPLIESHVIFYIPFGLTPVNLAENMAWNESLRQLEINLGSFQAKESKLVSFSIDGEAGQYLINGKVFGRWPAANSRPEETFEETIENFSVSVGGAGGPGILDFLKSLRSTPELVEFAETVAEPVSAVLAVGGVGAVVNSAVSASASFAAGISKFFSYLGLGFLRIRKRKPWGKVYNHLTGKPIEGASVKILDSQFKKVKDSQLTDTEGRFGFLVVPGEYYIKVSRRGFSEKETQLIKVSGPAQAINLEIALEPLQEALTQKSHKVLKAVHFIVDFVEKISPWILVVGFILSILSVALAPSVLGYIILGLYVALIVLKIVLHEIFFRSFGWVLDKSSEKPIALAVVRIFDANKNWLLGTRVTDDSGRFNFLIGPGDYYVTAVKESYKSFQSATTHFVKSGLISYDIKLEKV